MKKVSRTILTLVICLTLAVGTASAVSAPSQAPASYAADSPASGREEVIYANLTGGGTVKDLYTVTILTADKDGLITDYGSFASVTNLTDTTPLTLTGDQVSFNAKPGSYYIQGALKETALPWTIGITYLLDGKETLPEALAGQTGHVEIRLTTAANMAADTAADTAYDPSYFDNYMLTLSVSLDASLCRNIKASGGMTANAGSDKRITFMAMPGKPASFSVETDAAGFTMPGIEISAMPMSFSIDPPDTAGLKADLTKLTDAVGALSDGAAQLQSGSRDLKNGAADLSKGSALFDAGLGELNKNAAGLLGGSAQIKTALEQISGALNGSSGGLDLGGFAQLPDALDRTAAGLKDMSAGLGELKTAYDPAYTALKDAIAQIPVSSLSQDNIAKLYADNPASKDLIDTLVAYYQGGARTAATFASVKPVFDAVSETLGKTIAGADQMVGALSTMSAQIKAAMSGSDTAAQLAQLSTGLTALSDQYGEFHDGLTAFTAGTAQLGSQYGALNAGIGGIKDGTAQLYNGVSQASNGAAELNDAVKDMPQMVDEEINKLLEAYDKSDYKPASFLSDKNANTSSVQFVMKTAPIELPEKAAAPTEAPAPENLWTRFLALFK